MMTLGITCRSGCGKSTVTAVCGPGHPAGRRRPALREILLPALRCCPAGERFGADIIRADGTLDRRLLADRAFATPRGRRR
ncbi:MAG: dephospho-CoA kinase [Faecalibacterium prausnitzii]